eukprot:TRINITY_DN1956_c0_g1_i4.p1 TRINITY_DN1956_c0_g1~~TRINITY_DN1956_c0_g1_i4.p1  ORF type:complete len:629 (-),score=158.45 TRINITY_DN1956_c0_g1_i4:85-1938(-)
MVVSLKILVPPREQKKQRHGFRVFSFDDATTVADAAKLAATHFKVDDDPSTYALYDIMALVWLPVARSLSSLNLEPFTTLELHNRPILAKVVVDGTESLRPIAPEMNVNVIVQELTRHSAFKKPPSKPLALFAGKSSTPLEMTQSLVMQKVKADAELLSLKENSKAPSGPTFGVHLKTLVFPATPHLVPVLVQQCISYIESKALKSEGIFRLSGSANEIQSLKKSFDKGERVDLSSYKSEHVISGLLKLFLRELAEPVIPYHMYDAFAAVAMFRDNEELKIAACRHLVHTLPLPNKIILTQIFALCVRIAGFKDVNLMGAPNLASVLAPNIWRPKDENTMTIVMDTPWINYCGCVFIESFSQIFSSDQPFEYLALAQSLYEYTPQSEAELLMSGDNVHVMVYDKSNDGWWSGSSVSGSGLVPENYLRMLADFTPLKAVSFVTHSESSQITQQHTHTQSEDHTQHRPPPEHTEGGSTAKEKAFADLEELKRQFEVLARETHTLLESSSQFQGRAAQLMSAVHAHSQGESSTTSSSNVSDPAVVGIRESLEMLKSSLQYSENLLSDQLRLETGTHETQQSRARDLHVLTEDVKKFKEMLLEEVRARVALEEAWLQHRPQ